MADDAAVIRIDGDASGAVRAADQARAALGRLAAADAGSVQASVRAAQQRAEMERRHLELLDEVAKKSAATRAKMAASAEKAAAAERKAATASVEAWGKADPTGLFKPWFEARKQWLEGAHEIGAAAMMQRTALLAVGGAAATGAAVVVAAGAAIIGSSLEVISNLKAYDGVTMRHRDSLTEAAGATAFLTTKITELRVEVAGQMAPAITRSADAATGMAIGLEHVAEATGNADTSIAESILSMYQYDIAIGGVVRALWSMYDASAAVGQAARERDAAMNAFVGPVDTRTFMGRPLGPREAPRVNMEAEAEADRAAQAEADAMMLVTKATKDKAAATHAAAAAHKAAAPAVDAAIKQATEYAARLQAQWEILHDLDEAERARSAALLAQVAAVDSTVSSTIGVTQSGVDTAANAMIAGSLRVRDSWQQTTTSIVATASSVLGTLSSIISQYTDMQVGSFEEADAAQRRVLRERFRREKAAAIAMAVIQGALSVVQTLASTPYPLNIVLGVAQAAAVGVEVEMMRRQQPTYHRGGLAPDERLTYGGARVLGRETMAVYSDRRAPSQADVARAQTGERQAPDVAGPGVWSLVVDGVRERVRTFAGASQGYSPGRMAYGV